jgi:hypothetical protein
MLLFVYRKRGFCIGGGDDKAILRDKDLELRRNNMPEKLGQLHCGACMTTFSSMEDLNKHLEDCPAAINMFPLICKLWAGDDKTGHPLSHFIQSCHKEAHLIKRYAYAIADEMDTFHRSGIHADLCEKLGLDYTEFRPFESSDIKEMPNRKECEKILWEALNKYANQCL